MSMKCKQRERKEVAIQRIKNDRGLHRVKPLFECEEVAAVVSIRRKHLLRMVSGEQ